VTKNRYRAFFAAEKCVEVFNTFASNDTIGWVSKDAKEEKKEEYYKGKEVKGTLEKKEEYYKGKEVKGRK
jgi:hypothetical protein